eukprot:m.213718 g.213718  ORF g.213718 m.213718 type:complete len:88 (-) comp15864_c1_seq18:628-891(-)
MASNYPLRGGKGSLWEGGVRGIGFITSGDPTHWGITRMGYINKEMIHVSDWLPTLCDIAGCKLNGMETQTCIFIMKVKLIIKYSDSI